MLSIRLILGLGRLDYFNFYSVRWRVGVLRPVKPGIPSEYKLQLKKLACDHLKFGCISDREPMMRCSVSSVIGNGLSQQCCA